MKPAEGSDVGLRCQRWARTKSVQGERALRERMLDWLPPKVFGAHKHANGPHAAQGFSEFGGPQRRSSRPRWHLGHPDQVRELRCGEHAVTRLRMPEPQARVNQAEANEYLLGNVRQAREGVVGFRGLLLDKDYTLQQFRSGRYTDLKCYPHFREPPVSRSRSFFPDWAQEECQFSRVPIILHVPTPASNRLSQLLQVCDDYQELRVILARRGREDAASLGPESALEALAGYDPVFADTSTVTDSALVSLAYMYLGRDRTLFGSEEPFCLPRYLEFDDPQAGRVGVSANNYRCSRAHAAARYDALARDAVLLHVQSLQAMHYGLPTPAGRSDSCLTRIFNGNALALLVTPSGRQL